MQVWATEWDVFHCTPSRGGRGRRAAVDIFRSALFFCVWWDFVSFFRFLSFERTRPTASTRQPCLMYLATSILYPHPGEAIYYIPHIMEKNRTHARYL